MESAALRSFYDYAPPASRKDPEARKAYLGFLDAALRRELKYGLDAVDAEKAAGALGGRALLVIHSEDDGSVEIEDGERIFAAAKEPKQMVRGKDFGHCLGMRKAPQIYVPAVVGFLDAAFR